MKKLKFRNKLPYDLINKIISYREIHCLGDSLAMIFNYLSHVRFTKGLRLKTCIVQGATASGLANPNSQTKAMSTFYEYLNTKVSSKDYVLFQIGEVDCGFTIWYRAQKHNISVNSQLSFALSNYIKLIQYSMLKVDRKVIVTSAVLPTIKDDANFGDIAIKRREVKATQVERTNLTLEFNKQLERFCVENKLKFHNYSVQLLDEKTGVVKTKYLNTNPLDHHLDNQHFGDLVLKYL